MAQFGRPWKKPQMFTFGSTSSLATASSSSTSRSSGFPAPTTTTTNNSNSNINNNCLYARLNSRQILELNCTSLNLSSITPPAGPHPHHSSANLQASTTTAKHLFTIEGIQGRPISISVNSLGSTVAIAFEQTIVILRNLASSGSTATSVIEQVQLHLPAGFLWMDWHPLSPGDSHLAVLTRRNQLFLFNAASTCEDFSEPEVHVKLPGNHRLDPLVRCAFVKNAALVSTTASWSLFGLFLVSEGGDVRFFGPFVPRSFKARRTAWIEALRSQCTDGTARKWLQTCLSCAKFLSTSDGDTDWILIDTTATPFAACFDGLQPVLQGPFPIQPEPLEIHHLSSFDRVCDFAVFEDAETMAVAFASGKIDLLVVGGSGGGGGDDSLTPMWQLAGQGTNTSSSSRNAIRHDPDNVDKTKDSDGPVLILLESIDVCANKGSSDQSSTPGKRSVSHAVKIIHSFETAGGLTMLVSPGNDQLIRVKLVVSDEEIECSAGIVIEGLKAPAQVFLRGRLFPGAVALADAEDDDKYEEDESVDNDATVPAAEAASKLAPDLLKITNFAFPLGKLEIEGAALQLEGLLESTQKALQRLRTHQSQHCTFDRNARLPEAVNEEDCAILNEQLSKWQQDAVMPAMRLGHELALRSQELVQILRTQRQVLSRAHALLTAKPHRLQTIQQSLHTATAKNAQLQERLKQLRAKLPSSGEGRLGDAALLSALERMSSRLGSCMSDAATAPPPRKEDLVDVQLALQTEILHKLQKLLQ